MPSAFELFHYASWGSTALPNRIHERNKTLITEYIVAIIKENAMKRAEIYQF